MKSLTKTQLETFSKIRDEQFMEQWDRALSKPINRPTFRRIDNEVWKVLEQAPDYWISSTGRVWSGRVKKLLKASPDKELRLLISPVGEKPPKYYRVRPVDLYLEYFGEL